MIVRKTRIRYNYNMNQLCLKRTGILLPSTPGRLARNNAANDNFRPIAANDNTRDTAGQITAVTTTQPGHGATSLATSVTHMPFGPFASLSWGNGVTDARTFDQDYRMTSVKDVGTGNIQYLSYGYDADNNVHTVTDNVTPANDQTLTWDRDRAD